MTTNFTPAILPMCSSTQCCVAFCTICASKPAAFRVIDTHAGAGLYDLTGDKAARGANGMTESEGFLRRRTSRAGGGAACALSRSHTRAQRKRSARIYPGSPALARAWLRPQDRLIACELEPQATAALRANLRGDPRIKTLAIDGWTALIGLCAAEGAPRPRAGRSAVRGGRRFSAPLPRLGGRAPQMGDRHLCALVSDQGPPRAGRPGQTLRRLALAKDLRAELIVVALERPERLNGCGLILVNPPWTLENELSCLLPALAGILGRDGKGGFRLDWLAGEKTLHARYSPALSTGTQLVSSSVLAVTFRLLWGAGG